MEKNEKFKILKGWIDVSNLIKQINIFDIECPNCKSKELSFVDIVVRVVATLMPV